LKEVDKYKTLNKGFAATRRGKLMAIIFEIGPVPVLGGAMLGGVPVIVGGG
jgi:hypothetical protein